MMMFMFLGQYFYFCGGGSGGGVGGVGGGVIEEQEGFVDGFVKVLDDLYKMNYVMFFNVFLGVSGGFLVGFGGVYFGFELFLVYINFSSYFLVFVFFGGVVVVVGIGSLYLMVIISYFLYVLFFVGGYLVQLGLGCGVFIFKEELQIVFEVCSCDVMLFVFFINMEDQECIKVECKWLWNWLVVIKCWKWKLECIVCLEDKVKIFKVENVGLLSIVGFFWEQVVQFKQKVMIYVSNGCQLFFGVKGYVF